MKINMKINIIILIFIIFSNKIKSSINKNLYLKDLEKNKINKTEHFTRVFMINSIGLENYFSLKIKENNVLKINLNKKSEENKLLKLDLNEKKEYSKKQELEMQQLLNENKILKLNLDEKSKKIEYSEKQKVEMQQLLDENKILKINLDKKSEENGRLKIDLNKKEVEIQKLKGTKIYIEALNKYLTIEDLQRKIVVVNNSLLIGNTFYPALSENLKLEDKKIKLNAEWNKIKDKINKNYLENFFEKLIKDVEKNILNNDNKQRLIELINKKKEELKNLINKKDLDDDNISQNSENIEIEKINLIYTALNEINSEFNSLSKNLENEANELENKKNILEIKIEKLEELKENLKENLEENLKENFDIVRNKKSGNEKDVNKILTLNKIIATGIAKKIESISLYNQELIKNIIEELGKKYLNNIESDNNKNN